MVDVFEEGQVEVRGAVQLVDVVLEIRGDALKPLAALIGDDDGVAGRGDGGRVWRRGTARPGRHLDTRDDLSIRRADHLHVAAVDVRDDRVGHRGVERDAVSVLADAVADPERGLSEVHRVRRCRGRGRQIRALVDVERAAPGGRRFTLVDHPKLVRRWRRRFGRRRTGCGGATAAGRDDSESREDR